MANFPDSLGILKYTAVRWIAAVILLAAAGWLTISWQIELSRIGPIGHVKQAEIIPRSIAAFLEAAAAFTCAMTGGKMICLGIEIRRHKASLASSATPPA